MNTNKKNWRKEVNWRVCRKLGKGKKNWIRGKGIQGNKGKWKHGNEGKEKKEENTGIWRICRKITVKKSTQEIGFQESKKNEIQKKIIMKDRKWK